MGYLKTVLTELRDRTVVDASGRRHAGADLVGTLWDAAVSDALGPRRDDQVQTTLGEVRHAVRQRPDGPDLLEEFERLGRAA